VEGARRFCYPACIRTGRTRPLSGSKKGAKNPEPKLSR
jgi:hypothetical protein